ncbi:glycosyltransferase family 2 protein [Bradyrhizobium genosp. L]|uniref:glycosyltransferase family 2 protein n=1 Tax=Bradyrhizobium genosp. L TaxID=83637 RepID=UPI0018A302F2|nr:glycosyltransferase family 2 protein [Bradyrhizobium genosp. L]QPF86544.1 glycosyltransferase family 2 protein [Bradyrhizobium genosp. L]
MDVSVIIVNWNTRELLRNCLASVISQSRDTSYEIIVVDNASHDGSVSMCERDFPTVKLIANDRNRGFAAANNQAMQVASGRYYLLLNPDTVVLDTAIDRCVAYADSHPDIGVVGCQVLERDGQIQQTGFSFPSAWILFLTLTGLPRLFPHSSIFAKPQLGWWRRDTLEDIDVISGMFMLVRHEAIKQVGVMDESYFIYAEEADWCFRFSKAGWRRVFFPGAQIIHVDGGGKSTGQVNVKMLVQLQKSMLIYFRKNLGLGQWIAAKTLFLFSNAARLVGWLLPSVVTRDPVARSKAAAATAALRFHIFGVDPT